MKKRVLSIFLVIVMCSSMVMTAFAEEVTTGEVDVAAKAGGENEKVEVIITVSDHADGGQTTEKTTGEDGDVTESNLTVNYESTETVDAEGKIVSGESSYTVSNENGTYIAAGGSETSVEEKAPNAVVDVPLTSTDDPETEETENQNTAVGRPVGSLTISGDQKQNDQDGTYDYTIETVTGQGKVTITTHKITEEEKGNGTGEGFHYIHSETAPSADNDMMTDTVYPPLDAEDAAMTPGYNYVLLGNGNSSQYWPAIWFRSEDADAYDEKSGNYVFPHDGHKYKESLIYTDADGNGHYVRRNPKGIKDSDKNGKIPYRRIEGVYLDGQWVEDRETYTNYAVWSSVYQYQMMDPVTQKIFNTYCADMQTFTQDGHSYNMENVSDADYYSEEQAAMIRTVALNGYWGTKEGTGSLESVQELMRNAVDENGDPIFTREEVMALTDGAAMTATQMAIWNFSNAMSDIEFVNMHYVEKNENNESVEGSKGSHYTSLRDVPETKDDTVDVIFKLYEYLIAMDPTVIEEKNSSNTVITAENFVSDLSVSIVGKDVSAPNNYDDDKSNDVYVADVTFALVVAPSGKEGEELTVSIIDNAGNVLATGLVSGEGDVMTPGENNTYTFTAVPMAEGVQNFNITLSGVQNLDQGVYLYSSEVRMDEEGDELPSQTMVGVSEGLRTVDVSMNIEFTLDAEDEVVTRERVWREERHIPNEPPMEEIPPQDPPVEELPDPEVPLEELPEEAVPMDDLTEIFEEEVPLANVPMTGDCSLLFIGMSILSGTGLAGLALTKKREDEE